MLRTLFVLGLIAIGLRYALKSPFYALLFYLFLAYFRPESWMWSDWISGTNISFVAGVWVALYALIKQPRFNVGPWPLLLIVFLVHSLISALLSDAALPAWLGRPTFAFWQDFAKTIIIGYLCVVLIDDEKKLRLALIVIALSLGFEGTKQGLATLVLNPGSRNSNGWPNLGDNNGVGIGMLMLVSIVMGLITTSTHWVERYGGRIMVIGLLHRAITTYSRGAFLSAAGLLMYLILRSKRKVAGMLTFAVALALIIPAMPPAFWERMGTIQASATAESAEEVEASAAGRLHFWQVATIMAADHPVFGVGPYAFGRTYDEYDFSDGRFGRARSVHSAWFGLVAEVGFPGLALVLLLMARASWVTYRVRRASKRRKDLSDLASYGVAIEGALLVALVGGTFYPFQYMEPLWHCLALSMVVHRLAQERLAHPAEVLATAPAMANEPVRPRVRTDVQLPARTALRGR